MSSADDRPPSTPRLPDPDPGPNETLRIEASLPREAPVAPPIAEIPTRVAPPRLRASSGVEYQLHAPLASGGMAQVFYGLALEGGRRTPVALKRVPPGDATPELATMLYDEAVLGARVTHPNVVRTIDLVVSGEGALIVLEYVPGVSAAELLQTLRPKAGHGSAVPVPVPIATAIAIDVLHGLQAIHAARSEGGQPLAILHRDVSPQNVLLHENGTAKLSDFGVAHARRRLQKETDAGTVKGKLRYMAPEQIHGQASVSSDVYAVGIVLWELLLDRPLFTGTDGAIAAAKLLGQIEAPSRIGRPDAAAIELPLLKALAREPKDRFPSAASMAEGLAAASPPAPPADVAAFLAHHAHAELARRRATVQRMTAGSGDLAAPAPPASSELPIAVPPGHRRRPLFFVSAALVLAAVGGAALVVRASGTDPLPPEPEAPDAGALTSPPIAAPPPTESAPGVLPPARSGGPPAPSGRAGRGVTPRTAPKDCTSMPYTITSDGRTIWRRECFKP